MVALEWPRCGAPLPARPGAPAALDEAPRPAGGPSAEVTPCRAILSAIICSYSVIYESTGLPGLEDFDAVKDALPCCLAPVPSVPGLTPTP